jgi:Endonuclease/Exonuclease/phosphatase family.
MNMKRTVWLFAFFFLLRSYSVCAKQFTVATLNVDGLPAKILFFDANPDGPGAEGTKKMSSYLAAKNYDIIGVQENFNFHNELLSSINNIYSFDYWMGPIDMKGINIFNIINMKIDTDGLAIFWKKDIQSGSNYREAWTLNCGKLDHDNDDLMTKGFRRQELTLSDGMEIVVYDMHLDSSADDDFYADTDTGDREARKSQWTQLRNHLLTRLDRRPVIILGDTNSYFSRDDLEQVFFDPINNTGTHEVRNVWSEIGRDSYGDCIDKIIYINAVDADKKVEPVSYRIERDFVDENGKSIGDHWPVVATFNVVSTATGVDNISDVEAPETEWYTLSGVRLSGKPSGKGIYLRKGKKIYNSIINQ